MNTTEVETRRRVSWGWGVAGLVLALVTVGAAYGLARSALGIDVQILIIAGLLLALAVLAYLASRAGRAAAFVALAILLPYLLAGAYAYGQVQRLANAIEDVFGEETVEVPEETYPEDYVPLEPNPDATGADLNDDGIPDDAYEGQVCMSESSGEVHLCTMNGGEVDAR